MHRRPPCKRYHEAQRIKPDKNDVRGLAQLARTGLYKDVHVKSVECQAVRTLVAARKQFVTIRLHMENLIRGILRAFGFKIGTVTSAGFPAKVKVVIAREEHLVKKTMLAPLK